MVLVVVNITLVILILCILILVILGIILYHHIKISRYNNKLALKKESWEPVLFEYLSSKWTVGETALKVSNDYEILKDFLIPYLKNLSGEDYQLLQKLAQETGLTDFYLEKLKTGNNTEKIKAANFLGKVKEHSSLKLLQEHLYNKDKGVMTASAWAIAEIGEKDYFTLVLKNIINQTQMTYEGVTELSIQFGEGICQEIEVLLSDWLEDKKDLEEIYQTDKQTIISLLIDLLGHFKYISAVNLFEDLLKKESHPEILIHIFKALVKIEQPIEIDLKPYLNHENWVVRSQAVRYAGIIEEEIYFNLYKELLQNDDNWWVKYYAGETILQIGKIDCLKYIVEKQKAGYQMSNYILNQN